MSSQLTVSVIGGGPSGLFFCHNIENILKQQQENVCNNKDIPDINVTCFEKSNSPGGIWKALDSKTNTTNAATTTTNAATSNTDGNISGTCNINGKSTNTTGTSTSGTSTEMYDQLWTNGSSHCTEFYDYTYDEHFNGKPVTVYMKRQDLLEYILGRVTKNCTNFFEKYLQLNTEVQHVIYNNDEKKFHITIKDTITNVTEVRKFDKCIWACGENSKRNMPQSLVDMFRKNGFTGRIIHSADTKQLEKDVKGKRILLVGGGFSAEDLALQSIKLGVEKVYVSSRVESNQICWTKHWPQNKVEILHLQTPCNVTENGNCIQFHEVYWTPRGYKKYSDEIETEIRNIDTIILCTGYSVNLDMIDPSLFTSFPKYECKIKESVKVPDDWKMKEGILTEYTGDVEPDYNNIQYLSGYVHPEFYNGILINNTNMMVIATYSSYMPLIACDVYSRLLAGYITGTIQMPTKEHMIQENQKNVLEMLNVPYFRYMMDDKYFNIVDNLPNFWNNEEIGARNEIWDEVEWEEYVISMKRLADIMIKSNYPISFGTINELNEMGQTILNFGEYDYNNRAKLEYNNNNNDENEWKTFRDCTNANIFYSLYTGTKAIPLDKHWMDL